MYAMITMLGFFISIMIYGMLILSRTIPGDQNTVGLLIFISLIPTFILFKMATKRKKARKRRAFTQDTKDLVLRRQNYRCNMCGIGAEHWDFDHIGSRADNSPSNCQALCLNCHRTKTSRESRQKRKR